MYQYRLTIKDRNGQFIEWYTNCEHEAAYVIRDFKEEQAYYAQITGLVYYSYILEIGEFND